MVNIAGTLEQAMAIGHWSVATKRVIEQVAMVAMAKRQRGMKEAPLVVVGFLKSKGRMGPAMALQWQKLNI